MSPKKYLYALKLRKNICARNMTTEVAVDQLEQLGAAVVITEPRCVRSWGVPKQVFTQTCRSTATDPPDAGHNHTRRKNHKSGRENLSWNHSQLCVLLLPFIWSPSSLGGVHCAQRVGAHVNVHGCDGGGLVGRGEVEWHDICTNHQSTRWWVVVAGMVVPAGQATDGLATVQVSQWSALCAAAVPSPSCCRPATHRHPGVQCPAPQLTTSQPRLVRRMGGRCQDTGMSVASTLPPRSIDFCVTCVKLSQDSRGEKALSTPPPARPARPSAGR